MTKQQLKFVVLFVLLASFLSAQPADRFEGVRQSLRATGKLPKVVANESIATLDSATLAELERACNGQQFVGPCVGTVLPGVTATYAVTPNPSFRQRQLGFDLVFRLVHQPETAGLSEDNKFAIRAKRLLGHGVRRIQPNLYIAMPMLLPGTDSPADALTAAPIDGQPTDPLLPMQQDYLLIDNNARVWKDMADKKPVNDYQTVVVDFGTGVNASHPDLGPCAIEMSLSRSFTGDNAPLVDPGTGHGTQMAGILGACHNDIGIAGLGSAKVVMFKIFSLLPPDGTILGPDQYFSTTDGILAAIHALADLPYRIVIANMSFTYGGQIQEIHDAMKALEGKVLFVAATGNGGSDDPAEYPANEPLPNVVGVGAAADRTGKWADFSSRQGAKILALGQNIYTTTAGNSYAGFSGTSVSAPQVSGVAADLSLLHKEASPTLLAQALEAKGFNPNLPGYGMFTASGIPMFNAGAALDFLDNTQSIPVLNNPVGIYGAFTNSTTLAVGDVIAVYGQRLCDQTAMAPDYIHLPTQLGNCRVLFNNIPLPLYYASPSQINAALPSDFLQATGANFLALAHVDNLGNLLDITPWEIQLVPASPGPIRQDAYNPDSPVMLFGDDGSPVTQPTGGTHVHMYATGLGKVFPWSDGTQKILSPISIMWDGGNTSATAILSSWAVGVYDVSFVLPDPVPATLTLAVLGTSTTLNLPTN